MARVANPASFIEYEHLRFLIIDAPTDLNVEAYIREFKAHSVASLVRACSPTYDVSRVAKSGIDVHEMAFTDGEPPPEAVITNWLAVCDNHFKTRRDKKEAVAVHCVAGLGRAPVLVAIALIEEGLDPAEAIAYVRKKRRGAINQKQVKYLVEEYKPRAKGGCCIIM